MFYIDVALPVPLRKTFAYLPIEGTKPDDYIPGARVKVPFGKSNRHCVGVIDKISTDLSSLKNNNFDSSKLKKITSLLDSENVITNEISNLIKFSADYYHYFLGEIYSACMPKHIRAGEQVSDFYNKLVTLNTDSNFILSQKNLSKPQKKLFDLLKEHNNSLSLFSLNQFGIKNSTITSLTKKNWIFLKDIDAENIKSNNTHNMLCDGPLILNGEQAIAVDTISNNLDEFNSYLLYGITGSGKTEVYLHLINQVLKNQKQVLVLVPEIALTPQTIKRFSSRFNVRIALIHSKVYANTKTHDWLAAKDGDAKIIIGTRSGVFTPIKNLGLIIIDEEHDQSFKQQEGFKYNGRDLAIIRAKQLNIPILLGSATPSLESVANVINSKYKLLKLTERAGNSSLPQIKLLNTKQKKLNASLSEELINQIKLKLKQDQQVMLFLNRRGFAPVIKCNSCNWGGICDRCNVYYTLHKSDNSMVCHYCMNAKKMPQSCPECGSIDLNAYGVGTEQIEEYINKLFPKYKCIRIDRDTTRKKGELDTYLKQIHSNEPMILLGTQMLAKGHHFPNVTLVAILDVDSSLFSTDFRAAERITQLIIQVAGRAGRGDKKSEVIIQTMQPEHEVLQNILSKDYWQIACELYDIRKLANQPPCANWVLIRAESYDLNKTMVFLKSFLGLIQKIQTSEDFVIKTMGPILAPRVKKAGLFRGQLLLSSNERANLHKFMKKILNHVESLEQGSVRWTLDVDPQDIY